MSKTRYDSDGFQVVTRSSKHKSTKVPPKNIKFIKQDIEIDVEEAYKRILSCVEDLQNSVYLKDIIKAVSNILQGNKIVEIVCFGLGHIGECNISRYQLALLLNLKTYFKSQKVSAHDPIFYGSECALLHKLELNIIKENIEGNYVISEEGVTLVYLPHCPKQLTNNFLWSNWSLNLENCILLCNSFSSLIENQPSRMLKEVVPYINEIYPLTTEIILENNFIYKDIFNDTSIHYFLKGKLISVPPNFWVKKDKPEYQNTEEFITSLMIEKLTF